MITAPDNTVIPSLAAAQEPTSLYADPTQFNDRRAPQQGIAPDLSAQNGLSSQHGLSSFDASSLSSRSAAEGSASRVLAAADRGLYHAASAMKELYEMGDSPSCSTCGSIMTRNGSCYRCMECGSTSGCS